MPELLIVLAIVICWYAWRTYNKYVPLHAACKESESNIGVVLKKRENLVASIMTQTDAYGQFERELVLRLSEDMRTVNPSININRLRDAYPELLFDRRISEQLAHLSGLETELQDVIAEYNRKARELNELLRKFPEILFATTFGWKVVRYYES